MNLLRIAVIVGATFLSFLADAAITLTPLPGSTPQTARPSSQWPMPIGVVATDGGVPVTGVQVTFVLADPPFTTYILGNHAYTVVTDAQGVARVPVDLASASTLRGNFAMQATEPGGANASFALAVAGAAPAQVVVVSGDNQTVTAGEVFPQRFVAKVLDTDGAPVPYANVSFQPQVGGTFATFEYFAVGDANGIVTALPFTADEIPGPGFVAAVIPGGPYRDFHFTIVPPPPPRIYTLTPLPGTTPQTTRPNSFFPVQLGVVVRNPDGSPAPGVDIKFTGGPESVAYIPGVVLLPDYVNGVVITTDANGIALAASPMSPMGYMALDPGSAVITATNPQGLNDVQFQLFASGKPPSRIELLSGNGQAVPWGATFAPWVVRAWDEDDQAVAYAAIYYEVLRGAVGGQATFPINPYTDTVVVPADSRGVAASPTLVAITGPSGPGTGSARLEPPGATDRLVPSLDFNFSTGPFRPPVGLNNWAIPPLSIPAGRSTGIPFSVRLTDAAGHPLADMPVTFSTDKHCANFGGSTTFPATTDVSGIATSLPLTGKHASTSCATSATAMGLSLDLSVHVFDPKKVVATASPQLVQTQPDAFYDFEVRFTERGLPVHVSNFDIRSLHLGANYATTPVADIFDGTARLSFMANHQAGAYAIEFQAQGGKRLLIPVVQAP